MNERLKQEYTNWMSENEDTAGFFNPEELAQYFYNLALEDVKKELKPEKDISYPNDYERGSVDGRNELREELLDFIDKLNK